VAAFLAVAVGIAVTARPAAAQASKSAAAAKELVQALEAAKLDSIAAADPSEPDTFVAALYFPGAQILVVSARYAAPPLLVDKIASKSFRDIYIDLNSASVAGTKVFVIDQGIDGLVARPENDQAADTYENGSTTVAFDGDWRKAKMSEEDYMKAFATADERYARILALLAAQAKVGRS
jgi:hypothetical protein